LSIPGKAKTNPEKNELRNERKYKGKEKKRSGGKIEGRK
jgi:hypothetical protein